MEDAVLRDEKLHGEESSQSKHAYQRRKNDKITDELSQEVETSGERRRSQNLADTRLVIAIDRVFDDVEANKRNKRGCYERDYRPDPRGSVQAAIIACGGTE